MQKFLPFLLLLILPSQLLAQTYSCQLQDMCELPVASCESEIEEAPMSIDFSDESIIIEDNFGNRDEFQVLSVYRKDGEATYFTQGNDGPTTFSILSSGELHIFGFIGFAAVSVMLNAVCEAVQ